MSIVDAHLHCPTCGYDVFGLSDQSKCPECGARVGAALWNRLSEFDRPTLLQIRRGVRLLLLEAIAILTIVAALICSIVSSADRASIVLLVALPSIFIARIVAPFLIIRDVADAPNRRLAIIGEVAAVATIALVALFIAFDLFIGERLLRILSAMLLGMAVGSFAMAMPLSGLATRVSEHAAAQSLALTQRALGLSLCMLCAGIFGGTTFRIIGPAFGFLAMIGALVFVVATFFAVLSRRRLLRVISERTM